MGTTLGHSRSSLLRVGAGVSVLLLVAIVVMWGRSYWMIDRYAYSSKDGSRTTKLRSEMGRLSYWRMIEQPRIIVREPMYVSIAVLDEIPLQTLIEESCRFTYDALIGGDVKTGGYNRLFIVMPYWTVAFGCCILPVLHIDQRRRRRKRTTSDLPVFPPVPTIQS